MIIALPLAVCVRLCGLVLLLNEYPLHRYVVCLQDTDSIHSYEFNCIAQIHAYIKATVNKIHFELLSPGSIYVGKATTCVIGSWVDSLTDLYI